MPDDGERYVSDWCRAIGATVHVRGTDERPVIVVLHKGTTHTMGGVEIKCRMERALHEAQLREP